MASVAALARPIASSISFKVRGLSISMVTISNFGGVSFAKTTSRWFESE